MLEVSNFEVLFLFAIFWFRFIFRLFDFVETTDNIVIGRIVIQKGHEIAEPS